MSDFLQPRGENKEKAYTLILHNGRNESGRRAYMTGKHSRSIEPGTGKLNENRKQGNERERGTIGASPEGSGKVAHVDQRKTPQGRFQGYKTSVRKANTE